jgi:hypothetical protein
MRSRGHMTIDTVKDFVRRIVHWHEDGDAALLAEDPISKERIEEMQRDIDSKLRKGMKFTPAGPSGW